MKPALEIIAGIIILLSIFTVPAALLSMGWYFGEHIIKGLLNG